MKLAPVTILCFRRVIVTATIFGSSLLAACDGAVQLDDRELRDEFTLDLDDFTGPIDNGDPEAEFETAAALADVPTYSQLLDIKATESSNVAPLGLYMLFVLNDQGVPSIAKLVMIK